MHPDMETYLLISVKAATLAIIGADVLKLARYVIDMAQAGL